MKALRRALSMAGVDQLPIRIKHLERLSGERGGWQLHSQDGQAHKVQSVVICTALGSQGLLQIVRWMRARSGARPGHRPHPRRLGRVACGAHRAGINWAQRQSPVAGSNAEPGKPFVHQRLSGCAASRAAPEWLQDAGLASGTAYAHDPGDGRHHCWKHWNPAFFWLRGTTAMVFCSHLQQQNGSKNRSIMQR